MGWKWLLFSFKGRVNRAKYWAVILVPGVGAALLSILIITAVSLVGGQLNTTFSKVGNELQNQEKSISHQSSDARQIDVKTEASTNVTEIKKTNDPLVAVVAILSILIGIAAFIALPWAWLAITAKRLHDRNLSGWIQALPLAISIVAGILGATTAGNAVGLLSSLVSIGIFIICGFFKGTSGPNKYGQDPLQISSEGVVI